MYLDHVTVENHKFLPLFFRLPVGSKKYFKRSQTARLENTFLQKNEYIFSRHGVWSCEIGEHLMVLA